MSDGDLAFKQLIGNHLCCIINGAWQVGIRQQMMPNLRTKQQYAGWVLCREDWRQEVSRKLLSIASLQK